jgi:hypothetical protein
MSSSNINSSNSFDLLEQIHNDGFGVSYTDIDDDDATVAGTNIRGPSLTRITFKVPGDELAKDKAKAILILAKEVIDCLQVEFPSVKLLPWKTEEVTPLSNFKASLPTDPKIAEAFLFGYSRFFAKQNGIFRLLLQHDASIAREDIAEFGRANINQPKVQFLNPSQSNALQPTILGFLTGSTSEMAASPVFGEVLRKTFNLKVLGMKWNSINIKNAPKNSSWRDRQALQIEVDAVESREKDIPTAMALFFNNLTRDTSKTLFGTPMMFVPTPQGWQNSTRLSQRVRVQILGQATIVASISSIGLDNVNLLNKINPEGKTLMEALMAISSITPKKNKNGKEIFGRLFHAITPTTDTGCYTVSFFNVNLNEASSVISALPLFIESEFKISAATFCRTIFIEAAKAGQWDPATRVFLSQEDLAMDAMLEQIVELADTPPADVIISSDHQRAMAMTEDDANTQATDLRNKAPSPLDKGADDDDVSVLTGSTRTSKADRIADERLAIVHKDHLLALAEAKKEKQLMQEDFERRLAALSATTTVNTSTNTLTPESATLPASDNTETKSTPTRNIQRDLSDDEHVGGKEPTELQGSESELSDGMYDSNPTGLQSNESAAGLTVGDSGPSSSDENTSDEDDTDADRAPTPDEYIEPNKPHQKPVATMRRVVTGIDSSDGNSDGDDEDSSDGKYDNVGGDSDIGSFSDQVEYVGTTAPKDCEDSDSSNGDWSSKFDDVQVKVVANVSKSTKGTTLALAQKQTKKLNLSDLEESSDDSILKPGSSPDRFRKNKDLRLNFPSRAMIPDSQRTKTFSEPSKATDPDELTKSNKRYSLRSRAATTTGAPDGGCSP